MKTMTYQDPIFQLIQLPTQFRTLRQSIPRDLAKGETVDIFNAQGPGCIRHIWFMPSGDINFDAIITICVDGEKEPQVSMNMEKFFGVLLGQKPYRFDSEVFQHLPMTTGPVQGVGYNSYFPIPFAKSCRISVTANEKTGVCPQIDWHQYPAKTKITPYRFHAAYHAEMPAKHRGSILMADISGSGFLAGIIKGIRQRDFTDMIYHTKGQLWLIDGETGPHAINGHNEEDDFSFFWGYQPVMTRWIGCPYHRHEGRENQDGVIYRFFGPDPVSFSSSMLMRSCTRADDTEIVTYWYKVAGSTAPKVQSPAQWQVTGPFACLDYKTFLQPEVPEKLTGTWTDTIRDGNLELPVHKMDSEHTWIDLWRYYRNGTSPEAIINHSVYARTAIESKTSRNIKLRFGFDDWLSVWLNGKHLAVVRHDNGIQSAEIPCRLHKGKNELLVKLSNFQNIEKQLFVLSCVVTDKR